MQFLGRSRAYKFPRHPSGSACLHQPLVCGVSDEKVSDWVTRKRECVPILAWAPIRGASGSGATALCNSVAVQARIVFQSLPLGCRGGSNDSGFSVDPASLLQPAACEGDPTLICLLAPDGAALWSSVLQPMDSDISRAPVNWPTRSWRSSPVSRSISGPIFLASESHQSCR